MQNSLLAYGDLYYDEFIAKPIPISLPINEIGEIGRGPLHHPRNHSTTVI
jgi:hypothetical protein